MTIWVRNKTAFAFSLLTLFSFAWKSDKKKSDSFAKLNYDKVIAYDYTGGDSLMSVNKNVQLGEISAYSKKAILTKRQVAFINNILSDTATFTNGDAACFNPHFVLSYLKRNTVVGNIYICFECNMLEGSFDVPGIRYIKVATSTDNYSIQLNGFSQQGRIEINKLVKELNFSHTLDKNGNPIE